MSATDAQTDLRQAASRIDEAINVAAAARWSQEQQNALAKARIHVARARTLMQTAVNTPSETPTCDTDHDLPTEAEFVMTMLDTASLDAVTLLCQQCTEYALKVWTRGTGDTSDDVNGYEIRRLT